MTLFHPATGQVRVKGVTGTPNTVLHPWLQQESAAVVAALPPPNAVPDAVANRDVWARWQDGLSVRFTLLEELPPLRLLLILDNLTGHKKERGVRLLADGTRHYAVVHALEWELAEYGRVHPADFGEPCLGRTAPRQP